MEIPLRKEEGFFLFPCFYTSKYVILNSQIIQPRGHLGWRIGFQRGDPFGGSAEGNALCKRKEKGKWQKKFN